MKKHNTVLRVAQIASTLGMFALISSCSTFGGHKSSDEIASSGPTILNAKADPGTIELDANLRPRQNALLFADVKDFDSPIQNVHVRFIHVPIDISMKLIAGTTWGGELNTKQLRELAVSGQTIRYEANVIATNGKGQTAVSPSPISVSIVAPAPDQLGGIVGNDSRFNGGNQNKKQRKQPSDDSGSSQPATQDSPNGN